MAKTAIRHCSWGYSKNR